MEVEERTQVAIVGAGPAGLLLGRLLEQRGIENVILEARSRDYCEARIRAGVLEPGSRRTLIQAGVGERMEQEGILHSGIHLRFYGEDHHIPLAELAGSDPLTIYGQTEVVKDLIAARLESGAPLLFECGEVSVHGLTTPSPMVRYGQDGEERQLRCSVIAGCDGFHGVTRQTIPAGVQQTWEREYPFAWLGIMAEIFTPEDELIYALSERGFALRSLRSEQLSRLYIQVDPGEDIADWPDDRIWEELQLRLAAPGWTLPEGPVVEKGITPMRSFVAAPMRHGSLFLAGDAAHIVPPTGAKGLNLAIHDVTVLAQALERFFVAGDQSGLDAYSETCLRRVWRAQHFSWWMTQMLHRDPSDDEYGRQLQISQLRYVATSEAARTSLAENYVGLDL
ncbi:MAG TPA: 4-hydroxybenzoate 3-monooxygenase [Solirubrobacteraceae bacterium]|nr:4-hydroxybenzoate 3-monooxygenase [Solirubrobacteraceae bacterium]